MAVATAQSFELVTNDGWPRGELDVSPATRLAKESASVSRVWEKQVPAALLLVYNLQTDCLPDPKFPLCFEEALPWCSWRSLQRSLRPASRIYILGRSKLLLHL